MSSDTVIDHIRQAFADASRRQELLDAAGQRIAHAIELGDLWDRALTASEDEMDAMLDDIDRLHNELAFGQPDRALLGSASGGGESAKSDRWMAVATHAITTPADGVDRSIAILVLGVPGPLKTAVVECLCRFLANRGKCIVVDPDELSLLHAGAVGRRSTLDTVVVDDVDAVGREAIDQGLARGCNLVIDGRTNIVQQVDRIRGDGCDLMVLLVAQQLEAAWISRRDHDRKIAHSTVWAADLPRDRFDTEVRDLNDAIAALRSAVPAETLYVLDAERADVARVRLDSDRARAALEATFGGGPRGDRRVPPPVVPRASTEPPPPMAPAAPPARAAPGGTRPVRIVLPTATHAPPQANAPSGEDRSTADENSKYAPFSLRTRPTREEPVAGLLSSGVPDRADRRPADPPPRAGGGSSLDRGDPDQVDRLAHRRAQIRRICAAGGLDEPA